MPAPASRPRPVPTGFWARVARALLAIGLGLGIGARPAAAAEAAWYSPDAVAGASATFGRIAEAMGPAFQEAERRARSLGTGLERLDTGVALLGDRAPAGMADWAAEVRRTATGQHLALQRHLELLQDDTAAEFGAALARALPAASAGRTVTECAQSSMSSMMGKKALCEGADISPALAEAMDADPALRAAVDEIQAIPWPTVVPPDRAWAPAPVSGSARWVSTHALEQALLRPRLEAHQDRLMRALDALEARIAAGDAAALAAAQQHRADYEAALAADGAALFAALAASLERGERKGGPKATGVCANPARFGGCTGSDATKAVMGWLAADKKFRKELDRGLPPLP